MEGLDLNFIRAAQAAMRPSAIISKGEVVHRQTANRLGALAASCAVAAASSFAFASALTVSSCVPSSAALATAFAFRSSARGFAWW
jgi:hypothetical protein